MIRIGKPFFGIKFFLTWTQMHVMTHTQQKRKDIEGSWLKLSDYGNSPLCRNDNINKGSKQQVQKHIQEKEATTAMYYP